MRLSETYTKGVNRWRLVTRKVSLKLEILDKYVNYKSSHLQSIFFVFDSMKAYKILPDDLFFLLFQFLEIRNLY